MDGWHPLAVRVEAKKDGGTFLTGVGWKSVIHTTEVLAYRPSEKDYYGHQSWPHATIAGGFIHQHIPITRAARALKNVVGGVETNRARAIQVEVCAKAAEIHRLPGEQRKALADWLVWVHQQTGAPLTSPVFVGAEQRPAREHAPQRFGGTDWLTYSGVCGHQHVPENTHWDPGALNLNAVLAFNEEDDMPLTDADKAWLEEMVERKVAKPAGLYYEGIRQEMDVNHQGSKMERLFQRLQRDAINVRTGALTKIGEWLGKPYTPPGG